MAAPTRTVLLGLAALCLPALANVPRAALLSEKPHQGGAGFVLASHRGAAADNPLIAMGIAGYLCDEGRSSRSTGKERDAETGLDYFGARYFSGAQGRFTSPDPLGASARASNPQTWNRYTYALNNPLRYVDPDGLEVPDDCVKDQKCTIVVKVNVIYDRTVNRGRVLTAQQKQQFEKGQIAKAQKDFGNSNIKLDVTYTEGSYTVSANGQPQLTGTQADALNVIVSSATPNGAAGVSGVNKKTDTAVTFVNFDEVHDRNAFPAFTNTLSHEFAHQFIGDVYRPKSYFTYLGREAAADGRIAGQAAGISQQGFREGVAPRRYAVPLNPEANKPRQ
ncbi:MAG: RHS repeat-associated core domain-containing protein [Acidobacteriota bacterium]